MQLVLRFGYLGFWCVIILSCEFHMFCSLPFHLNSSFMLIVLLYFLMYWRIYILLLFIRLSRNCFLSEFIHVRCSEQFNSFSSNCNEIHPLIGASLMIKVVFLSSPFYTTNWQKLSDKSWRFCLIFPICFVYSIWKPDYLI